MVLAENLHGTAGVVAGPDAVGLALALLSAQPSQACLIIPLLALFPALAGVACVRLSDGLSARFSGSALAGLIAGLVYGIVTGVLSLVTSVGAAVALQDVDFIAATGASNVVGVLVSVVIAVVLGVVAGAIGGALTPAPKQFTR